MFTETFFTVYKKSCHYYDTSKAAVKVKSFSVARFQSTCNKLCNLYIT